MENISCESVPLKDASNESNDLIIDVFLNPRKEDEMEERDKAKKEHIKHVFRSLNLLSNYTNLFNLMKHSNLPCFQS